MEHVLRAIRVVQPVRNGGIDWWQSAQIDVWYSSALRSRFELKRLVRRPRSCGFHCQAHRSYTHEGSAAAFLDEYRGAVRFGTKLLMAPRGRSVVTIVSGAGKGKEGQDRVLDPGHAAMACSIGRKVDQVTGTNPSFIKLGTIHLILLRRNKGGVATA